MRSRLQCAVHVHICTRSLYSRYIICVVKVKASRVPEIHNIILYTVSLETMQIYYVHDERRGPIAAASMRFVNNNNNNSYIR